MFINVMAYNHYYYFPLCYLCRNINTTSEDGPLSSNKLKIPVVIASLFFSGNDVLVCIHQLSS